MCEIIDFATQRKLMRLKNEITFVCLCLGIAGVSLRAGSISETSFVDQRAAMFTTLARLLFELHEIPDALCA